MSMRKSSLPIMLCLLICGKGLHAQILWTPDELPFMLSHDTTGIKEMRSYELSNTIMGKRYTQDTVRYNRYGYELYPGIRRAFDTLGRITDWQWMSHHKRVQEGHVEYSAEGLVEYYRFSEYRNYPNTEPDTLTRAFRLIDTSWLDGVGLVRCVYAAAETHVEAAAYNRIPTTIHDTVICEKVFSANKQLIQEYVESNGHLEMNYFEYQKYYYYDPDGLKIKEKDFYMNRRTDSLNYQYNSLGQLIGWTGKSYTEEGVCDILVRCQSNGVPEEFTEIWFYDQYDEVADTLMPVQYTHRTFYDSRGNISRKEIPNLPVIEYDYDYWGQ